MRQPYVVRAAANLGEQLTMEGAMAGGGERIMANHELKDFLYTPDSTWEKWQMVNKVGDSFLGDQANIVVDYMKNTGPALWSNSNLSSESDKRSTQ
jgi:hypothetical protein